MIGGLDNLLAERVARWPCVVCGKWGQLSLGIVHSEFTKRSIHGSMVKATDTQRTWHTPSGTYPYESLMVAGRESGQNFSCAPVKSCLGSKHFSN